MKSLRMLRAGVRMLRASVRTLRASVSRWGTNLFVLIYNKKINLYIIGPEKTGTTSLASFLNEHPALTFGLTKESHTYRASGNSSVFMLRLRDRVIHLGRGVKRNAIMFDATTSNSTNPFAASVLRDSSKSAKVIFLFRDPVERFVSQYWWDKRNDWTSATSLAEYLSFCLEERVLNAQDRHYSSSKASPIRSDFDMQVTSGNVAALLYGRYVDIVKRYDQFDSLALELADLTTDYDKTISKISDFLGVDVQPFNESSFPHLIKAPSWTHEKMEDEWKESIQYLSGYYKKHNAGLEELCNRRFSFSP